MQRRPLMIAGGVFGLLLFCALFFWGFANIQSFMTSMGQMAGEKGSAILGTRVEVGEVRVDSPWSLTVRDIALYDKRDEMLLKAESATVRFSLFGMITDKPAKAVEEVLVRRPEARIEKRADGTWNYADLIEEDSEPSGFAGVVRGEYASLDFRMDGKSLSLSDVNGSVDFADEKAMRIAVKAKQDAAALSAEGTIGGENAKLYVEAEDVLVENYLAWLPKGLLPESVEIRRGRVETLTAELEKHGDALSYQGRGTFSGGAVRVLETEIEKIEGTADFSEREVRLVASAEAAGQPANVRGTVNLSGKEPELHLFARSEGFDPGEIFKESPFHGAAAFSAQIEGTPASPSVSGAFRLEKGTLADYEIKNAKATATFVNNRITVPSLTADILGGHVEAAGEFDASTMRFDGHAKATDVDASPLAEVLPGISGRASADLGFAGDADALERTSVYGSVLAHDISYLDISAPELSASF